MERSALENALSETLKILSDAIITSSYKGKIQSNGQEAKNAAIRSSAPIRQVHTVVRDSIYAELVDRGMKAQVWPPLGQYSPELKVTGLLKAKNQDVTITVDAHTPEIISTGVNAGKVDPIGLKATNSSLVIGVRSQLSSLEKNFDTLAERAFAETLNLRLRAPRITLGEVYLVPIHEFADSDLKNNVVGFKNSVINLDKFIRIFKSISGKKNGDELNSLYKYDETALIVADFSSPQVKILWTEEEIARTFGEQTALAMESLLPSTFTRRIVDAYAASLASVKYD
jgi:hypothetical protein